MKKIHRKVIGLQAKWIRKTAKHVKSKFALTYNQGMYPHKNGVTKMKKSGNKINDLAVYLEDKQHEKESIAKDIFWFGCTAEQAAKTCIKQKDTILASMYRRIYHAMDRNIQPCFKFKKVILHEFLTDNWAQEYAEGIIDTVGY